ncbi:MAG: hypothetical protein QOF53_3361 [Nocardioidaceae bacterium]|jgi:hypothetical protein|nr:hypothetical protein [Nocardioidaceae bacterium]
MTNAQAMAAYNVNAAIKTGQNPYQPSGGALLNDNP